MKRFYKEVAARGDADGHAILLDGRPVRTPAKAALEVPTPQLAEAIVGEWEAQGDTIDPRSMPLTGLANAAIDRVAPEQAAFVRALAAYGESDLLCYRADTPDSLVARQAERWDPLLAWARRRFDVDFEVVCGILHRPQPATTLERLRKAVEARDAFALAGLSPLITIPGSLIIALALAEGEIDVSTAWAATTVDEAWQIAQWGEDKDEAQRLEARRREFEAAYRFLRLLSPPSQGTPQEASEAQAGAGEKGVTGDSDEKGCAVCGHLIGYHWPEDEHCTAQDCGCPGYVDPDPALPSINRAR